MNLLFLLLPIIFNLAYPLDGETHLRRKNDGDELKFPFSRYDYYPSYCSTPDEIKKRKIPNVRKEVDESMNTTRIIQVFTFIRHGSRTPEKSIRIPGKNSSCWKGYMDSEADTSIWNCDLYSNNESEKVWIENPGTCDFSQLLNEGYEQEVAAGSILRDAYISTDSDNMRLFEGVDESEILEPSTIMLYGDINDLIVMSGEAFMQGFLQTQRTERFERKSNIRRDLNRPKKTNCPLVEKLLLAAKQYSYSIEEMNEKEALNNIIRDDLSSTISIRAVKECLMTTYCTDRTFPDVLNDFDGVEDEDGESKFMRILRYDELKRIRPLFHNESALAKVYSSRLWVEVVKRIQMADKIENFHKFDNDQDLTFILKFLKVNRFFLYSGHAKEILFLMASLGSNMTKVLKYPSYASALIIEIHAVFQKSNISGRAFRMLYDGKVVTPYVDNCFGQELCDLQVLLDVVGRFATSELNCYAEGDTIFY